MVEGVERKRGWKTCYFLLNYASYVRHQSTVEAIRRLGLSVTTNAGFYSYKSGDTIIVVIPKRLQKRGEEQTVDLKDLEFYYVEVEA